MNCVDVLQHLDDLGFAASAPIEAGHTNQHLVAVQHAVHFLGRQIEIVAALFRHDEAEAVGMPFYTALDEIELLRQTELALAVEHHLAVALHRPEAALEQVALVFGDVQLLGKGRRHRPGSLPRSAIAGCIPGSAAAIRNARFHAHRTDRPGEWRVSGVCLRGRADLIFVDNLISAL